MSSDLKNQFINHMILNRYSKETIRNYVRIITDLAKFHNKPPDQLNNEQIQEYLLYLIKDRKLSWGTCNIYYSGLACLYKKVLKRDKTTFTLPPGPRIKKLPQVLSVEEAIKLEPKHIESDPSRMMIRIEQAKGRKDRYTLLSRHLLDELRVYWQKYKPVKWLFAGNDGRYLSYAGARLAYVKAKKKPA